MMLLGFNIPVTTIVLAIIIVIGIIILSRIGKLLLKLILNSVVGLAAIFALDYVFNAGIPLKLYVIITTALFGIPAVGVFVVLRFFGVPF